MAQFTISAKFLGTQVEFGLPNLDMYTLAEIWVDVYMFTCSSIPSPDERFKAEVKLPWNGEYKLIQNDDDMQGVFKEFKERSLETIRFDFDLLPNTSPTEIVDLISDDDDAVYQSPNLSDILSDGDEDYSPATDIVHSTDNDHLRDSLRASEEIHLEDDVEEDNADNGILDTNSHMSMLGRSTGDNSTEEDKFSNAASLKFDQFDMMDNNSDEDEGISRHVRNRRGIPHKEADNGRVVLEPRSSNMFCVRNLTANMQAKYRGQHSRLFVWNASNKSTKAEFKEEISKLREVNENAYNDMMGIPLQHWALHAFDYHVKSEHTTNNLSECFNGWVDKYRAQPTLSLMVSIRRKVMRRMNKRLEDAKNWSSVLSPLVNKKLIERQDEAQFVEVLCASDNEYEVRGGITFYIVNLKTQSYDCCLWELSGIPCKHAMAVITAMRMQGQEAYMRTYNNVIHPIPDQTAWPTIKTRKVLPPLHKGCLVAPRRIENVALKKALNKKGVVG
ncbi:hypothetical protein LWI28_014922 [Acer negundo]|uniref:SWIM-type domain-containing protein n=1 Tax=Acer negundo TaxID=4023 RepID=A0AAD5J0A8_ACENE|nr:hypothetical protein LWI28_014922 [Acer negundo]